MRVKILFSAFFLCTLISAQAQELNLCKPEQFEKVEFHIQGYCGSSHYITPLQLDLKNHSSESKRVKIDHGQMIIPVDSAYQTFVVTRDELIVLKPGENKNIQLWAMCTESSDAAPNKEIDYVVGEIADPNLKLLVDFIAQHEHYNYEAQTAVWAMVGDYQLTDIVGFDTTLTRNLVKIVAEANGLEIPPPPPQDDYARNYYAPVSTYKATMKGQFRYNLFEEREIIIAMFDEDNIVVRELFRDENCQAGDHEMEFKFDSTQYRDKLYYVRLLEDGEILLELEVTKPPHNRRG